MGKDGYYIELSKKIINPEGYKKITETDVEILYKVPEMLDINESQVVSINILDNLLSSLFSFHISLIGIWFI